MSERFPNDFSVVELRGVPKLSLKQAEKHIARRARYLIRRIGELKAGSAEESGVAEMLRKELVSIVVVMENVKR